ncbi:MAG: hydrogenase expression/formation protein HypE [Desulfurococcales archaeon]|nr:hydrogenase expression/formation protein HypE [Desulfurococcales archaeon]
MLLGRRVTLAEGAGGKETWEAIHSLIVSKVREDLRKVGEGFGIDVMDDGAVIPVGGKYLIIASDSFTVKPIRFPGGDIGSLAAHGVINDVVMMGGDPFAFMDTVIVEEGMDYDELSDILNSLVKALESDEVALIGGDFKVMPKGSVDKIVISGVGLGYAERPIIDNELRPGDKVIVTAPIAEHGATILASQIGLIEKVEGLRSDTKSLKSSVLPVIRKYGTWIHAARDPTRGGLAATLSEWASQTKLMIKVWRGDIPIRREVADFLDAMGVDPLSLACEGVAVLAVRPDVADEVVSELRKMGETQATIVGEVTQPPTPVLSGRVVAVTEVGGMTLIEPKSVNLPRIC